MKNEIQQIFFTKTLHVIQLDYIALNTFLEFNYQRNLFIGFSLLNSIVSAGCLVLTFITRHQNKMYEHNEIIHICIPGHASVTNRLYYLEQYFCTMLAAKAMHRKNLFFSSLD